MGISDAGYPFITSYLKGEESHLLTAEHFGKLTKAAEFQEAVGVIRDTDIGAYLEGVLVKDFDELDQRLWQYLGGLLRRIRWFQLTPRHVLSLIDAYMAKYDVLNIKSAIGAVLSGRKVSMVPLGDLSELGLTEALGKADGIAVIRGLVAQAGLVNYARILAGYAGEKDVASRLVLEARLDREYYRNLIAVSGKVLDRTVLVPTIGTMVDLANLKVLLRNAGGALGVGSADYLIDGGHALSLSGMAGLLGLKPEELAERVPYPYQKLAAEALASLEKGQTLTVDEIIDRSQLQLLKERLSFRLMSPVLIVWYLVLKETELRDLRLIFKFMLDRRPLDAVKDLLVIAA
ncbi:MAG: V-type ATPase subunit [Chloroflexota bacterium]